jgi:DNA-3-methyladenine glycosylase
VLTWAKAQDREPNFVRQNIPAKQGLSKVRVKEASSADESRACAIRRLRRDELPADTVALARFLIGKIVVRELDGERLAGRIVETEAYPPGDPAAHHFRGPTPRNRSMFLHRGHAYVYFTYGNHFMLNVSSETPGVGGGVLIRALEPLAGIQQMQSHRKTETLLDLTRGPGRLASALKIDRTLDGLDFCIPGPLWLGAAKPAKRVPRRARGQCPEPPRQVGVTQATVITIGRSTRIGISRAAHRVLRFYERGNPFVSGPLRLRS